MRKTHLRRNRGPKGLRLAILVALLPAATSFAQSTRGDIRGTVGRVTRNLRQIDDNDDEAVKSLAEHAYERGGYTWDVI